MKEKKKERVKGQVKIMKKIILKKIMIGSMAALITVSGSVSNMTTIAEAARQTEHVNTVITLNLNGGKLPENTELTFNSQIDMVLPIPERTGYQFMGWFDNEEFSGEAVSIIYAGSTTENTTLYAKWKIKGYKVILNLNGGNLPEGTDLTFDIGTQAVLPTPTRENYTFAGWYDNEKCNGTPITVITENDYGERSLYAKWIPSECNITLNLNGGKLPDGVEITHYPGTITQLPIPVYHGFNFEGWYLTKDFDGRAVSFIPEDASGDITYYAKWSYENLQTPPPAKEEKELKTGTLVTIGKTTYKVSSSKKHTLTFIESYNMRINIPATVKISGITYKVTEVAAKSCKLNTKVKSVVIGQNVKIIGKYAFDGCKNLKKITINSKILCTVGKKALRGISPKCSVLMPASKFSTYRKLFQSKVQASTVTFKKYE